MSVKKFIRKLGLVCGKNLLLRRNQRIITLVEFFWPLICVIVCMFMLDKSQGHGRLQIDTDHKVAAEEPRSSIQDIDLKWPPLWCRDKSFIAYTPDNPEIAQVIQLVAASICSDSSLTMGTLAVKDEHTLEENYKNGWHSDENFRAAVVFTDGLQELRTPGSSNGAIPYKIRMCPFEWSDDLKNKLSSMRFPSTRKVLPRRGDRESRNKTDYFLIKVANNLYGSSELSRSDDVTRIGPNEDNVKRYVESGFVGLQLSIDKALVKQLTGTDPTTTILLQPFSYPSYQKKSVSHGFLLAIFATYYGGGLFFYVLFASMTKNVVGEKQTGITELLRLTGISKSMQWLGWWIHFLTPQLFVITLLTVFAYIPLFLKLAAVELEYTDPTLFWVIMFLFICASLAFGFFVCSLFQKPMHALIVTILVWDLISFIDVFNPSPSRGVTIGLSIHPGWAFAKLFRNVGAAYNSVSDESDMASASNWFTLTRRLDSSNGSEVTNLELMLMLLADILVYMGLALYFDSVLPSQFGIKRPWYLFRCKEEKWQGTVSPEVRLPDSTSGSVEGVSSAAVSDSPVTPTSFEPDPVGARVGVDVQDIRKRFGNGKIAVDGVSLRMFEGDIFVLLGHNGAGKTTLISILTGFEAPTAGTAIVDGNDIRQDMNKARHRMGYCSQHNMLFENLRVAEQIRFFGMIRGMSRGKAEEEANSLLEKMGISNKASTFAKELSGGQKRKLCLAMALSGGTKVILLDEPTSGMDPQARRDVWDLLLKLRGERTILLTTHFMEEADVLGDRIGIMAGGKLQCCGSTAYLKKFYGTGYTLKLTLNEGVGAPQSPPNNDSSNASPSASQLGTREASERHLETKRHPAAEPILELARKHIPDATYKEDARVEANEVFLMLPDETATTTALFKMFSELMGQKGKHGIYTVGLSQPTMDEVFVRVGTLADVDEEQNETTTKDDQDTFEKAPKVKSHICGQLTALLVKKYICSTRKWAMLLSVALIPLVIFMTFVHITNSHLTPPRSPTKKPITRKIQHTNFSLAISLSNYDKPVTFYSDNFINSQTLAAVIGPSAKEVGVPVCTELLNVGEKDRVKYKRNYIVAAEVKSASEFIAMFNLYPYHAAPLAINIATNALLKYKDSNDNHRIFVTNHPFYDEPPQQPTSRQLPSQMTNTIEEAPGRFSVLFPYVNIGFMVLASSFIVVPVEEKLCKLKHLQMMTGVNPLVYWGAAFIWDYMVYSFIVLIMLIYLLIFDHWLGYGLMTGRVGWLVLAVILMLYGFAAISFSYLHSLRANSVAGGFSFVLIFHLISILINSLLSSSPFALFWLLPTVSFLKALSSYATTAEMFNNCPIIRKSGCLPEDYGVWKWESKDPLTNENRPALGQELLALFIAGLIYSIILLLIEFRVFPKLKLCDEEEPYLQKEITDHDVLYEMERVNSLIASGNVESDSLVVENLYKSFRSFPAVSCLQFGVHHGECFGLLGVNAAGKTTAFRMITGDLKPTLGNIYGFGTSLDKDWRKFLSNIGYCPQFDAIFPQFTGKEMLQLFAGLRGVPYKSRGYEAMRWLARVNLEKSANVRCGKYSGGMKRRLSTAMAMIGDPALVLLDEPTSGVDPMARRQFWKILDKLKASGQSVILTSHSMEECEYLCSRLGIMVNGQFACFGGVQHLKTKFAQGYSLTVKLKSMNVDKSKFDDQVANFEEAIKTRFEPCVLKDKHQNLLQYSLQNTCITWDMLFKMLEEIKAEYADLVEDYSVNETSLEDVFIALAKEQDYVEPYKKSICSC